MQTKQQKQQKALNNLLAQLQDEKIQRQALQAQSYYLIEPSHNELRLAHEVKNLKINMGLTGEIFIPSTMPEFCKEV